MKWLIRISNAHRQLSEMEISTILGGHQVRWVNPLIAIINTSEEQILKLLRYSHSIRNVLRQPIYQCQITNEYLTLSQDVDSLDNKNIEGTFSARAFRVLETESHLTSPQIEKLFGKIILENYPNLQVDLVQPDHRFIIYYWQTGMAFGWEYIEKKYSEIGGRAPKKSPYFGGGAMKPLLCRILVNLQYPHTPTILDAFCGQGGILREIADLGLFAIGIEVSTRVVREAKINNRYFSFDGSINLIQGDALIPPFRKEAISQIVSDPPYALQTTTKGIQPSKLIQTWLRRQEPGTTIIMTLPSTMEFEVPSNWRQEFEIQDFVHKSMIRVARKLRKVE